MSGYVEAGYTVALLTLAGYSASVVLRERFARRRLAAPAAAPGRRVDGGEAPGPPPEGEPADGPRGRTKVDAADAAPGGSAGGAGAEAGAP